MIVQRLLLRNFRNYAHAEVTFSPGLNFIYGDNGQGKTNLLEAIYFLITGRSFRTKHLIDLLKNKEQEMYIEMHFVKHGIAQSLKLFYDGARRVVTHNYTTYPALTSLLGVLQGVILSPNDQMLIKGAPALRRRFLDMQLAQIDPLYVQQLTRYLTAMQHRNALLRQKKMQDMHIWEEQMAAAAAYIVQQRYCTTEHLNQKICDIQTNTIATSDSLSLSFHNSALQQVSSMSQLKDYYLERWNKLRPREVEFGATLSGPHKDDIHISINGQTAQDFASEGQQRHGVAVLQLAQWQNMKQVSNLLPLLLVDDVGLSLDSKRQQSLLQTLVATGAQLFLTAPVVLPLPDEESTFYFCVEQGYISLEKR